MGASIIGESEAGLPNFAKLGPSRAAMLAVPGILACGVGAGGYGAGGLGREVGGGDGGGVGGMGGWAGHLPDSCDRSQWSEAQSIDVRAQMDSRFGPAPASPITDGTAGRMGRVEVNHRKPGRGESKRINPTQRGECGRNAMGERGEVGLEYGRGGIGSDLRGGGGGRGGGVIDGRGDGDNGRKQGIEIRRMR